MVVLIMVVVIADIEDRWIGTSDPRYIQNLCGTSYRASYDPMLCHALL